MHIRSHYTQALAKHGFDCDPAQLAAVDALDRVSEALCNIQQTEPWLARLRQRLTASTTRRAPARGVYLWGDVGRGKTFVMDVFYDALPITGKRRYHFHRLMYRVHRQLRALAGTSDPIVTVARELAAETQVLCFDEFFVSDIGDAMILGRLLDALFSRGVTLVATSNSPPDELYRDGLQRQQFLPAIALIQQHTEVIYMDSGSDYRLRVLRQLELWHSPLDSVAEVNLERYFNAIAPDEGSRNECIEILGRNIKLRRRAETIAWFDFDQLCDGPRSQNDYIELARVFQTVLLSAVPSLGPENENEARRFIALVDEFYERKVKLIVSAALPIEKLYQGTRLQREFQRTASRLHEMQSDRYLGTPHIP